MDYQSFKENLRPIYNEDRLLMEVGLTPLQGDRFQPTGFPELGAANYQRPDGTEMILIESAQSMANRLEVVCWDDEKNDLVKELAGISYIKILKDDKFLTSSILEAHRINSPYILESGDTSFLDKLREEVGVMEEGPVDLSLLAKVTMKYDCSSLLHGLFLSKKELAGGRLRLPRTLSSFIEAEEVEPVESGGVKLDHVSPKGSGEGAKIGFGHIPFARTEYTARKITAYFNIDLRQIRGYRLGDVGFDFLVGLAFFKIQKFLKEGLRLRTACDLKVVDGIKITRPNGFKLPTFEEISAVIPEIIEKVKEEALFAEPPVTEVIFKPKEKEKKEEKKERIETSE